MGSGWGAGAGRRGIARAASLQRQHPAPLTHCSLLTTHCSLLTTHHSLLTTHCSPLTTHHSPLTASYCSPRRRHLAAAATYATSRSRRTSSQAATPATVCDGGMPAGTTPAGVQLLTQLIMYPCTCCMRARACACSVRSCFRRSSLIETSSAPRRNPPRHAPG